MRRDRGEVGELGVGRPNVGEAGLELVNQLLGPFLLSKGTTYHPGLVLPGHAVVGVVAGLGQGRGDLRQCGVVALGDPGVQGEDQIGPEPGDLLEVQLG